MKFIRWSDQGKRKKTQSSVGDITEDAFAEIAIASESESSNAVRVTFRRDDAPECSALARLSLAAAVHWRSWKIVAL